MSGDFLFQNTPLEIRREKGRCGGQEKRKVGINFNPDCAVGGYYIAQSGLNALPVLRFTVASSGASSLSFGAAA